MLRLKPKHESDSKLIPMIEKFLIKGEEIKSTKPNEHRRFFDELLSFHSQAVEQAQVDAITRALINYDFAYQLESQVLPYLKDEVIEYALDHIIVTYQHASEGYSALAIAKFKLATLLLNNNKFEKATEVLEAIIKNKLLQEFDKHECFILTKETSVECLIETFNMMLNKINEDAIDSVTKVNLCNQLLRIIKKFPDQLHQPIYLKAAFTSLSNLLKVLLKDKGEDQDTLEKVIFLADLALKTLKPVSVAEAYKPFLATFYYYKFCAQMKKKQPILKEEYEKLLRLNAVPYNAEIARASFSKYIEKQSDSDKKQEILETISQGSQSPSEEDRLTGLTRKLKTLNWGFVQEDFEDSKKVHEKITFFSAEIQTIETEINELIKDDHHTLALFYLHCNNYIHNMIKDLINYNAKFSNVLAEAEKHLKRIHDEFLEKNLESTHPLFLKLMDMDRHTATSLFSRDIMQELIAENYIFFLTSPYVNFNKVNLINLFVWLCKNFLEDLKAEYSESLKTLDPTVLQDLAFSCGLLIQLMDKYSGFFEEDALTARVEILQIRQEIVKIKSIITPAVLEDLTYGGYLVALAEPLHSRPSSPDLKVSPLEHDSLHSRPLAKKMSPEEKSRIITDKRKAKREMQKKEKEKRDQQKLTLSATVASDAGIISHSIQSDLSKDPQVLLDSTPKAPMDSVLSDQVSKAPIVETIKVQRIPDQKARVSKGPKILAPQASAPVSVPKDPKVSRDSIAKAPEALKVSQKSHHGRVIFRPKLAGDHDLSVTDKSKTPVVSKDIQVLPSSGMSTSSSVTSSSLTTSSKMTYADLVKASLKNLSNPDLTLVSNPASTTASDSASVTSTMIRTSSSSSITKLMSKPQKPKSKKKHALSASAPAFVSTVASVSVTASVSTTASASTTALVTTLPSPSITASAQLSSPQTLAVTPTGSSIETTTAPSISSSMPPTSVLSQPFSSLSRSPSSTTSASSAIQKEETTDLIKKQEEIIEEQGRVIGRLKRRLYGKDKRRMPFSYRTMAYSGQVQPVISSPPPQFVGSQPMTYSGQVQFVASYPHQQVSAQPTITGWSYLQPSPSPSYTGASVEYVTYVTPAVGLSAPVAYVQDSPPSQVTYYSSLSNPHAFHQPVAPTVSSAPAPVVGLIPGM